MASSKSHTSKSRRSRQASKVFMTSGSMEAPEPEEVVRHTGIGGHNIQYVHYTGDRHYEPLKLEEITPGILKGNTLDGQHSVDVRLDLLDIKSDDVFAKLVSLGDSLHSIALRALDLYHIPGVLTPILERISGLDLSNNSLNEFSISDMMPKLRDLTELNLSGNNLQQLPKTFKQAQGLKRLFLSNNRLLSLQNIEAPSLQWCVVGDNEVKKIDEFLSSSKCEKSLQVLYLARNKINTLPGDIKMFKSLIDLDISGNNLKVLPLELFKLPSLQYLNASGNRISHVPGFSTQSTSFLESKLKTVDLSDNKLSKLPEHLVFLAEKVDVSNNSIKFIRGNLLQKLSFNSEKNLAIKGNPLIFPPASKVGDDGLRGLLSFFGAIRNKVKQRQGMKMFVVGSEQCGKTSFLKTLVDEFPHLADEPTLLASYDELFVDIDAPGDVVATNIVAPMDSSQTLLALTSNLTDRSKQTSTTVAVSSSNMALARPESPDPKTTSDPTVYPPFTQTTPYVPVGDSTYDVSASRKRYDEIPSGILPKRNRDEWSSSNYSVLKQVDAPLLLPLARQQKTYKGFTIQDANDIPKDVPDNRRKRVKKPQPEKNEKEVVTPMLMESDPAAKWKCVQLPVIDFTGRDLLATLRLHFFESGAMYLVVYDVSSVPGSTPQTEAIKNWYKENVACYLEEIFALCKDAYIILIATCSDKVPIAMEAILKCDAVRTLAKKQNEERIVTLQSQANAIDGKSQITMADQEKLVFLKSLLDNQNIRISEKSILFSSNVEGTFSSSTINVLTELLQTGNVANGTESFDPFFSSALEPINNLHSEIIENIEILASSMRFPIVENKNFEDIFASQYLVMVDNFAKQIPKFLHSTGHIFWSTKSASLSELVVLRPGFLAEFLGALFAYVFDDRALTPSFLATMVDAGKRLFQLTQIEVHDGIERFVKTGILNCQIGELLVRKGLNIRHSEILRTNLGSASRKSVSSAPAGTERSHANNQKAAPTSVTSAPIHVCVEKFSVGFQLAYEFDENSLEYYTLFHAKIAEIDVKNPRIVKVSKPLQKHRKEHEKKTVGVALDAFKRNKVPVQKARPSSKTSPGSRPNSSAMEEEESTFSFLPFPKNSKIGRLPLASPASEIAAGGRNSALSIENANASRRLLLFPSLRPEVLPEAFRNAIDDAWENLSSDMWIGASITFPTNFYPECAYEDIVTRIRQNVETLEYGYVWRFGAFGKFMDSATCFVKIMHHPTSAIDCNFSLPTTATKEASGEEEDMRRFPENTISIELRSSPDTPSVESAKLSIAAGHLFTQKTSNDYIMNLWERMHRILTVVDGYCSSFTSLMIDRRVRCPCCGKLSFNGEWTAPRELQAFHNKECPSCGKSIDTAYLVQPKSSQRELGERIIKDIQKTRALEVLREKKVFNDDDSLCSEDDLDGVFEEGDGILEDTMNFSNKRQSRFQRNRTLATNSTSSGTNRVPSGGKSVKEIADRAQLLTMM